MPIETMTAFEFVTSCRKRKESWSTVIFVAGIKLLVIAYDVFKKGIHEVYVVIKDKETEKSVLRIPEMYIQKESDKMSDIFGSIVQGVV